MAAGGPVARHQSLAAAIDWSYRLLPEPEQRLFARHVGVRGRRRPARRCTASPTRRASEDDVLDRLARLVDRSMVVAVSAVHSPVPGSGDAAGVRPDAASRPRAPTVALAHRHAAYYVELAERAGARSAGPGRAGLGGRGAGRLRQHACRVRLGPRRPATPTSPSGWSPPCPSSSTCASGTRPRAGPSGYWSRRIPSHPRYVAAVGAAARGAWNRGDFPLGPAAGSPGRRAACRPPGTPRIAYPGDVLADVALYEGDVDRRAAALHRRGAARPCRGRPDPAGLDALLRRDLRGGPARPGARRRAGAGEPRGRGRDGQPDGRSRWRATRWAWC